MRPGVSISATDVRDVDRYFSVDYLNVITSFWCGAFQCKYDLKLLRNQIHRRNFPQRGSLIYTMRQDNGPDKLEKVLSAIKIRAKLNSKQMMRYFLKEKICFFSI